MRAGGHPGEPTGSRNTLLPNGIRLSGVPQGHWTSLSPVAYHRGTDVRPALRPVPDKVIHWDRW